MDDNIKEVRKKNLRKIIDSRFHGSVNAFAKRLNRHSTYLYNILAGKKPIGERVVRAIELELGLMPNELDQEDSADIEIERFTFVNLYSTKLSAGRGNKVFVEEIIDQYPIGTSIIRKNGWNPKDLCCFDVLGDSMEPTLHDGSRVLINTAYQDIIDNKIYALRNGDQIFIKRLYKILNYDKVIIRSDNLSYPELEIDLTNEQNDLKIIGMVVLRLEGPL